MRFRFLIDWYCVQRSHARCCMALSSILLLLSWPLAALTQSAMPVTQQKTPITELIIIDAGVPDKSVFSQKLSPNIAVKELNSDADGAQQLTLLLQQYKNLKALHLVSHASDGMLLLGNSQLTANTATPLLYQALNNALVPGADLLLYGCELAAHPSGLQLLQAFWLKITYYTADIVLMHLGYNATTTQHYGMYDENTPVK
jgi:hypothetical protein